MVVLVAGSVYSSIVFTGFVILQNNRVIQFFNYSLYTIPLLPGGLDGKASAYNAGDQGSIPGSGRSPGEGNGNPLQYSCLENPMDGGTCLGYSP